MACNNTTYFEMLQNNSDLLLEYYKTSFYVNLLDYHVPKAMQVNKIVTPIWIFIGIFGNIISAMVWANPRMRTCNTAAYYLTCLSVADLTYLILCLLFELQNPWLLGILDMHGWCQIFNALNMGVQYFCVFLVFAFTVERFLSLCFPFKSERFGKTRTPRIICCLLGVAVLLSLPQTYFWAIHPLVSECQIRTDTAMRSEISFFSVYNWSTELAVFGVLPLLVLFLNVAVLNKIRKVGNLKVGTQQSNSRISTRTANNEHGSSLLTSDREVNKQLGRTNGGYKASSNKGTTVTLLWVSFFLILTMLPNTLMYVLQEMVNFGDLPCRMEDMGGDVS
ncbi:thyrotropin-releasing hormone receptor-like [Plakobranchus ocellatus]|uniref:Thyrotropin-releasing hormone receptor-like n=1 Tax=Plakobranchus ocellatus TaxID=259542 RepID=A0AAV4DK85_9GAST|nr:thyrotropin-releasing hormone receptor-like [Plakobranchus ocellatus]